MVLSAVRTAPPLTAVVQNDEDPVFTITDLLPHLGREQNQKKLPDAITAENLNVVLGSLPIADADAENRIKLSILGLLNEMYGITERDFVTAEIEIVPAFKARDVGLGPLHDRRLRP